MEHGERFRDDAECRLSKMLQQKTSHSRHRIFSPPSSSSSLDDMRCTANQQSCSHTQDQEEEEYAQHQDSVAVFHHTLKKSLFDG